MKAAFIQYSEAIAEKHGTKKLWEIADINFPTLDKFVPVPELIEKIQEAKPGDTTTKGNFFTCNLNGKAVLLAFGVTNEAGEKGIAFLEPKRGGSSTVPDAPYRIIDLILKINSRLN